MVMTVDARAADNSMAGKEIVASNTVAAAKIIVTASPVTQYEQVSKDGVNVSVVGADQIARLNAKDLPSALRQVPGVTVSRYNPIGAYGGAEGGSVYIRGEGTARPGSEIKIYTDGAPRESGVWAHPLMDIVPIDFAESISVFKGPQPQTYPGTFGAVDIRTKQRYRPGYETELDLSCGRYDTLMGGFSSGGKTGRLDYYVGVAHKESDGLRDHGESDLDNQFFRIGWDLSDEDHLSYIFTRTDNWSRDPGRIDEPTPIRNQFDTETKTHVIRLDDVRYYFQGYSLVYYDEGEIRWAKDHLSDSNPSSPAGNSDTDWENYGFRSSYDVPIDDFTLTGSLDIESAGGKTKNTTTTGKVPFQYKGRFTTVAPYAGIRYAWDIGDVTVTPSIGGRYYYNSEFDSEPAPCLALTVEKGGAQFFVSHARGVNYPGVYVKGVSASTMNRLDAEVVDNTEAGVHLDLSGKVSVQASVFHSDSDNRLEYTSSGLLNVGEVRTDGAELALHLTPSEDLAFFAGATYLHPENNPAPRMPKFNTSAGVSYTFFHFIRWDVDAEYVDSQYAYSVRSTPDIEKVDSYLVLNTKITLDLSAFSNQKGELYVAVENLTDENYEFFPGYTMSGVMWYTGINLKF